MNFFHFAIGAMALVEGAIAQRFAPELTAAAAVYLAFAMAFAIVLFTHPEPPAAG